MDGLARLMINMIIKKTQIKTCCSNRMYKRIFLCAVLTAIYMCSNQKTLTQRTSRETKKPHVMRANATSTRQCRCIMSVQSTPRSRGQRHAESEVNDLSSCAGSAANAREDIPLEFLSQTLWKKDAQESTIDISKAN